MKRRLLITSVSIAILGAASLATPWSAAAATEDVTGTVQATTEIVTDTAETTVETVVATVEETAEDTAATTDQTVEQVTQTAETTDATGAAEDATTAATSVGSGTNGSRDTSSATGSGKQTTTASSGTGSTTDASAEAPAGSRSISASRSKSAGPTAGGRGAPHMTRRVLAMPFEPSREELRDLLSVGQRLGERQKVLGTRISGDATIAASDSAATERSIGAQLAHTGTTIILPLVIALMLVVGGSSANAVGRRTHLTRARIV